MRLSLIAFFLAAAFIQVSFSKYIQQQKLVGTNYVGQSWQGSSVQLSADGNTLAVGGYLDNNGVGATWVFTQSEGVWSQKGQKLVGTGNVGGNAGFATLSGDGKTLAIGGSANYNNTGAVWIYTYSGSSWKQYKNEIVAPDAIGKASQGWVSALNYYGTLLAFTGVYDNNNVGATWIYEKIGGSWVYQKKFTPTGGAAGEQGYAVAVSNDGTVVATSAPYDGNGVVYIYTKTSSGWSTSTITASDATVNAAFGASVSFSGDGKTLAVGGAGDNNNNGATWIFTLSSGSWSQYGSKIVGTGAVDPAQQGFWVSLNGDGTVLALSGWNDDNNIGATWIFTLSSGSWSQYGSKIVATGAVGPTQQGYYVSLSSDGNTLAVSAWNDSNGVGATFTFVDIVYPFPSSYTVLVAWLFNGNALDASGNGNSAIVPHKEYYSFPQPSQPNNQALLPKGAAVVSTNPISFGSQLSIQVIFKVKGLGTPFHVIDLLPNSNSPLSDSVLSVTVDNKGRIVLSNPSTNTVLATSLKDVKREEISSLVLSVDSSSGSIKIYLNAINVLSSAFSFAGGNYYLSSASSLHGYVDQVIAYAQETQNISDVNVGGPVGF